MGFNKNIPEGYLYIANGEQYLNEAVVSATSLRKVDSNAHVTLLTSMDVSSDLFDSIVYRPLNIANWQEGLLYKTRYMYEVSPYKRTFFVDSDTYFCDNCRELFDILEYYDVCLCHTPNDAGRIKVKNNKVLEGYFPYNTGVMLFKKNRKNRKLFKSWFAFYKLKIKEYLTDQTAFNEALLYSRSRLYVLQNIYNARTPYHISLMREPVKIIHGRHDNFEEIASILNTHRCNRLWNSDTQEIVIRKKRV